MRTVRNGLLAGIAAVALAASAGLALAKVPALHKMTIRLPDGEMAQIQYTGNVAPQVTFSQAPLPADFYAPAAPFSELDRISAEMNREMDALMRQADSIAMPLWSPEQIYRADLRSAPMGTAQYSVVSTQLGNGGFCMQSMRITSRGNGEHPKVVTHTYGNCSGGMGRATFGSAPDAWHERADRHTIQVNARPSERGSGPSLVDAVYRPQH